MIFNVKVTNAANRTIQENLDNFAEVQEFLNRAEKRGFLTAVVKATKENGESKSIAYSYDGENWVRI